MSPRTNIIVKNNNLDSTEDEKIDIESKQYNDLLKIYEIAMIQVTDTMNGIKERINRMYGYTIIEKVDSRVKSKTSITNKLKKKGISPTYKALVDNIDDIAGVRIVCPLKDDIFFIKQIIFIGIQVSMNIDKVNIPLKVFFTFFFSATTTNNDIRILAT